MAITDIPIFGMLREKMQWHQQRQRLLAENVANADTPGFRPKDLRELDFRNPAPPASIGLSRSNAAHIASVGGTGTDFQVERNGKFAVRPAGNAVSIEDEMMKVAQNQMDFQAATALYSRSLGLIKTAFGK